MDFWHVNFKQLGGETAGDVTLEDKGKRMVDVCALSRGAIVRSRLDYCSGETNVCLDGLCTRCCWHRTASSSRATACSLMIACVKALVCKSSEMATHTASLVVAAYARRLVEQKAVENTEGDH